MREQLNENPIVQVALIGVLVAVALFVFVLKPGGGSEEETASSAGPTVASVNGVTATGDSPGEAVENAVANLEEGSVAAAAPAGSTPVSVPAPPPPAEYRAAYRANKTVVLLIVHNGGIDDRRVKVASEALAGMEDVALIEVPVRQLPRYAAITVGLQINRVPALVAVRPRKLSGGVPQASVDYGFQTRETVVQAVRDASYKGPERSYHPE
ncbi:MAG: hypothetical protein U0R71_06325 [Solirubrobacterales bacterium]